MSDEARRGEWDLDSIAAWRCKRLTEAGYPEEEAYLLARRLDIDLQVAVDLLLKGCPVSTAIRILT